MTDVSLSSVVGRGISPPTALFAGATSGTPGQSLITYVGGTETSRTTASLANALSLTSSGVLTFLGYGSGSNALGAGVEVKVTIDGTEVLDDTGTFNATESRCPVGSVYDNASNSATTNGQIVFNESLLIEFAGDGVDPIYLTYDYYLT